MFKRWQSPSSSYEKRCLATETLFLGGENEVLYGRVLNTLIVIDSSNVPIKQIVRKLCLFKRWQSPSSSYGRRCLGTDTIFLGGQNKVSMDIYYLHR